MVCASESDRKLKKRMAYFPSAWNTIFFGSALHIFSRSHKVLELSSDFIYVYWIMVFFIFWKLRSDKAQFCETWIRNKSVWCAFFRPRLMNRILSAHLWTRRGFLRFPPPSHMFPLMRNMHQAEGLCGPNCWFSIFPSKGENKSLTNYLCQNDLRFSQMFFRGFEPRKIKRSSPP